MANVRVICPTCNAELSIGEEHLGQQVDCGSCLAVFVAEDAKSKKQPYKMRRPADDAAEDEDDDRPRKKRRRRRDDDEDDYDYSPPGSRRGGDGGGTALATTSLILGILSIPMACCCGFFSLPISLGAAITGGIALKNPEGKGMAITGMILGILGIGLFVAALAIGLGANMANFNQMNR
jgi:hypothetical protein